MCFWNDSAQTEQTAAILTRAGSSDLSLSMRLRRGRRLRRARRAIAHERAVASVRRDEHAVETALDRVRRSTTA